MYAIIISRMNMIYIFILHLCFFEQANCIDRINFCYILSLTEMIAFSGTSSRCYLLSFRNLILKSSSLPVQVYSTQNWGKDRWTSPLSQFLSLVQINFIFVDTALILSIYTFKRSHKILVLLNDTRLRDVTRYWCYLTLLL